MFSQILKILTPDIILQAVKENPQLILETLHKFDTFKLLGNSLNNDQQMALSSHTGLVNQFLNTEPSKVSIRTWADEFIKFIKLLEEEAAKVAVPAVLDETSIRAALRAEIEKEVRDEIIAKSLVPKLPPIDSSAKILADLEEKIKELTLAKSK